MQGYNGPTMSTGEPSTLGNWLKLCIRHFGEMSPATRYLQNKIKEQGANAIVVRHQTDFAKDLEALHGDAPLAPTARTR